MISKIAEFARALYRRALVQPDPVFTTCHMRGVETLVVGRGILVFRRSRAGGPRANHGAQS